MLIVLTAISPNLDVLAFLVAMLLAENIQDVLAAVKGEHFPGRSAEGSP